MKKSNTKKFLTKSNLTLLIATVALLLGVVSLAWASFAWDVHLNQASIDSEQIYNLTITNARQDICLENSIKPCTKEAVAKFYEY